MKKHNINIGIIGLGRIGRMHVENIIQHFPMINIKGFIDPKPNKEILNLLEDQDDLHDNIDNLLSDETIEAVIICSPTPTHYELIKKCAKHKKHIFCEKPISFSENEIEEIIDIMHKEKILIQIGLNRRFDNDFMLMKKKVDEGLVGKVHMIHITNHDANMPSLNFLESSGGMIFDLCIHDFDMLNFITGQKIKEIFVNGGIFIEPQLENIKDIDNALITIELDNGILCSIDSSRQTHYGYDQRIEVFGSKGALSVDNERENLCFFSDYKSTKASRIKYSFVERFKQSYINELEHFFECVASKTSPDVGPENILFAVRAAIAGTKSLETGQPQRVQK